MELDSAPVPGERETDAEPQGMHSGIGPPRCMCPDWLPIEPGKYAFQLPLYRPSFSLNLPSDEVSPIEVQTGKEGAVHP